MVDKTGLLSPVAISVDQPDFLEWKIDFCRPCIHLRPLLIAEIIQFQACGLRLKPFPAVAPRIQMGGQPFTCICQRSSGGGLVADQRGAHHQGGGRRDFFRKPDQIFKNQGIPVASQVKMGLLIRRDELKPDLNRTGEQGQQVFKKSQAAGLEDRRDPGLLDLKQQLRDKRSLGARLTASERNPGDLSGCGVILFQGLMQQIPGGGSDPDHLQSRGWAFFEAFSAGVTALMVNFQPLIALVEASLGANPVALLAVDAHFWVPVEFGILRMVQVGTAPGGWEWVPFEDDIGVKFFPFPTGEMPDFQDRPLYGRLHRLGGCVVLCHLLT